MSDDKEKIAESTGNGTYRIELDLPTQPTDEIAYPSGSRVVIIITALCLAVFLVALDQTIIATAIPRITDRFNSIADIGWYGSVSFFSIQAT